MAVMSNDLLVSALTGFRSTFNEAFPAARVPQPWPAMTMQIKSTKKVEQIDWFGTVPQMVDATRGETVFGDLEDYSYSLEPNTYKSAITVQLRAFEDDTARIAPKSRQLAQEAARQPGQLIFESFELGTSALAFDGVAFFANTRVLGASANIDNIISGAYGDATVAEFQAGLIAAQAQMQAFQDDNGRPMQLTGNMIVVPPALMQTAWFSLQPGDGSSTPPVMPAGSQLGFTAAGYTVQVNPYLTAADNWYLLHVGGPESESRPFIFIDRLVPSVNGPASMDDPEVRDGERLKYVVRGRWVNGYGDPRLAVQVIDA